MGGIQGWQLVVILVIVLLLFGAAKLPKLAKSMGESARIFKSEVKSMRDDDKSQHESSEENGADEQRSVSGPVLDANGNAYDSSSEPRKNSQS